MWRQPEFKTHWLVWQKKCFLWFKQGSHNNSISCRVLHKMKAPYYFKFFSNNTYWTFNCWYKYKLLIYNHISLPRLSKGSDLRGPVWAKPIWPPDESQELAAEGTSGAGAKISARSSMADCQTKGQKSTFSTFKNIFFRSIQHASIHRRSQKACNGDI